MKSEMKFRIVFSSLTMVALMNAATAAAGMPTGIIQSNLLSTTTQQKATHSSNSASSNGNGDDANANTQIAASLKEALKQEQFANPLKAAGMMTQRARRSYKLPGNLDLSQFYTPQGIYDVSNSAEGSDEMTQQELEQERQKFLRLMTILEAATAKSAGNDGEPNAAAAAAVMEPVIALMSNHPAKNRGRGAGSRLDNDNSRQIDDLDWLDDPISIHRHRVRTRRAHGGIDGEQEYLGSYNFSPRQMHKRVNDFMDNDREYIPSYTLRQLFSKAQRQDPRYTLRHRFLL